MALLLFTHITKCLPRKGECWVSARQKLVLETQKGLSDIYESIKCRLVFQENWVPIFVVPDIWKECHDETPFSPPPLALSPTSTGSQWTV